MALHPSTSLGRTLASSYHVKKEATGAESLMTRRELAQWLSRYRDATIKYQVAPLCPLTLTHNALASSTGATLDRNAANESSFDFVWRKLLTVPVTVRLTLTAHLPPPSDR